MIVVVEDQEDIRRAMVRLLGRLGWRIETAKTGAEAKELLTGGLRPRCVVLDYMLPDVDGTDLLAWMKKQGYDLPVVIYSAIDDWPTIHRAKEMGAAAWVVKGGRNADLLFDVLRKICPPRAGSPTASVPLTDRPG